MTKVCFEKDGGVLTIHVTRNDKITVCGLPVKEQPWGAVIKEIHCKKCWARFNG